MLQRSQRRWRIFVAEGHNLTVNNQDRWLIQMRERAANTDATAAVIIDINPLSDIGMRCRGMCCRGVNFRVAPLFAFCFSVRESGAHLKSNCRFAGAHKIARVHQVRNIHIFKYSKFCHFQFYVLEPFLEEF